MPDTATTLDDVVGATAQLYELPADVLDALVAVGSRDADLALVLAHLADSTARTARLAEALLPVADQVATFAATIERDGIGGLLGGGGGLLGLLSPGT